MAGEESERSGRRARQVLPAGLVILFLLLVLVIGGAERGALPLLASLAVGATATPEPLLPTRTPLPTATAEPVLAEAALATATRPPDPTATATAEPTPTATSTTRPTPAGTATSSPLPAAEARRRFGTSGLSEDIELAQAQGLHIPVFLDWNDRVDPLPEGTEFWQTIRLSRQGIVITRSELEQAIDAFPGSVWIVGNEPDVIWQDNIPPQQYATLYHDVYELIKARDASARIAIGGVTQPTPLRLAYLDIVLDTYEEQYGRPMPVDVWTVHAFILREEAGSWGVDIPPGMDGAEGRLYEIEDHIDLTIFRQNLVDFRRWMAARGYREQPLAVTEYGILMPEEFGFPPEAVANFMTETFDYFLTASDETGDPADGGRLVQNWFWYSVYDPESYPTGNLVDRDTGELTELGRVYADYLAGLSE